MATPALSVLRQAQDERIMVLVPFPLVLSLSKDAQRTLPPEARAL